MVAAQTKQECLKKTQDLLEALEKFPLSRPYSAVTGDFPKSRKYISREGQRWLSEARKKNFHTSFGVARRD